MFPPTRDGSRDVSRGSRNAGGDGLAVRVAHWALAGIESAAGFAVREQVRHQRGETGCQRLIPPFSHSQIRQCSGSRSSGVRASAPRACRRPRCATPAAVCRGGVSPLRLRPGTVLQAGSLPVPFGCCVAFVAWAGVRRDFPGQSGCRRRPHDFKRGSEAMGLLSVKCARSPRRPSR